MGRDHTHRAPATAPASPAHIRAAVEDDTASWLEAEARTSDRSVMRQSGRILDAWAAVFRALPAMESAVLDRLMGSPEELKEVVRGGLARWLARGG